MSLTCIGYHGTKIENVSNINENGYNISAESKWFGQGVYFFEDLPPLTYGNIEAKSWAIRAKKFYRWAVFKAIIKSEKYIDLVNNKEHKEKYSRIRDKLKEIHKRTIGDRPPFGEIIVFKKLEESADIEFIRVATDGIWDYNYPTYVIQRYQLQICVKNTRCIIKNILYEAGYGLRSTNA